MHFNSVIIFLATIATLATELTLAALPSGSCSAPRVRKEWRRLTDGERSAFLSAVKALKARGPSSASASGNGMASWNYDQFVDAHWKNVDVAHGVPDFLPWHRFYIYGYEAALRSIDSSIDLPFWDWSLDSQNPGASDIFSSQSFGGNGRSSDHCVVDGVTAGWKIVYPTKQERPLSDCVTRCNGFTSFYPPEAITGMLSQAQTYDGFRSALESGPHGVVHNQIGGDCGDMGGMYSANDPLFFMHHAMVDRIWARWQDQCNYSFTNLFVSDRNTPMTPFGYSPNDVLSIAAGTPLCYTYGPSASDAPLSSKCPPGTASASTTASSGSSSTTTTTTTATISSSSSSSSSSTESASALQSAIPTLSEDAIKNMLNDSWFKNVLLSLVPNAPHSQNTSTVSLHRRTPQEYQDPNSIDINAIVQQAVSAAVKAAGIPEIQLAGGLLNTILPTIYTPDPHVLIKAPPAGDFSDLKHLRQIQQVSASWIKMNRLNETFVRQCEVLSMHIIDQYNNRKGYVSSAALTNYGMYNKLGRWNVTITVSVTKS